MMGWFHKITGIANPEQRQINKYNSQQSELFKENNTSIECALIILKNENLNKHKNILIFLQASKLREYDLRNLKQNKIFIRMMIFWVRKITMITFYQH